MSSEDDINTGYCKQDTCDVPSTSHVSATCSPYVSLSPSASSALSRYADYLRAMYANRPVAKADKISGLPLYIKLALVKKERVSRAEAEEFQQRTVCLQLSNSSIPVAVSYTVDSSSTADSMSNS